MWNKMKHYVIFVIFLSICVTINASDCPSVAKRADTEPSRVFSGLQKFTFDLLRQRVKENANTNVFFSSMSIYRTLLLAYFGSAGGTENLLSNKLYLDWSQNKDQVISEYFHEKALRLENLKAESELKFNIVDKFFFDSQVPVKDCLKQTFSDELELLNIHQDPEKAKDHINAWIEEVTHQHIKNLVPSGMIKTDTKLALANAAYFEGTWAYKFNKELTKEQDFFKTPSQPVKVQMMKISEEFEFGDNSVLNSYIVRLPYQRKLYKKNKIELVVILPKEKKEHALEEMIEKMTSKALFDSLQETRSLEVNLEIPKFEFEETTELKNTLISMGFGDAFSEAADFSGFIESTTLGLDEAIHKAKIQVDEDGTVASAATLLTLRPVSANPFDPVSLRVDHPFLFMIYNHADNSVLFTGVYRGP